MNKITGLWLIALLCMTILLSFSCGSSKDSLNNKENPAENRVQEQAKTYRLIVSFFSPGNGIDHEMKQKYVAYLSVEHPQISFEEINWGKEGEIDFCFPLEELNEDQSNQFVESSKAFLKDSSRIRISEFSEGRQ